MTVFCGLFRNKIDDAARLRIAVKCRGGPRDHFDRLKPEGLDRRVEVPFLVLRLAVNERCYLEAAHAHPVGVVVGAVRIDKARRVAKRVVDLAKDFLFELLLFNDCNGLRRFFRKHVDFENLRRDVDGVERNNCFAGIGCSRCGIRSVSGCRAECCDGRKQREHDRCRAAKSVRDGHDLFDNKNENDSY